MSENKRLILIDGHALAYRSYFALQRSGLKNAVGESTFAVYGFLSKVLQVLEDMPDYIAISFDMGMSGRELIYPDYKATRDKMPDDMPAQLDYIQALVSAFDIPILSGEGLEADDVIGTVAYQAEEQGCLVEIITGDRDLLQLLTPQINVWLPDRSKDKNNGDRLWTTLDFREKYNNLLPRQLIEIKALMGDTSDNIPGVKGIGEKGALKLISNYQSLENVYANLDALTNSERQKLIAGREMAFLSRELATIKLDMPITLDLEACQIQNIKVQEVLDLFQHLRFGANTLNRFKAIIEVVQPDTLPKDLGEGSETSAEVPAETNQDYFHPPHKIIQDEAALADMVSRLEQAQMIAFDTETTSTDNMTADLVGISLSVDGVEGFYIPLGHQNGVEQAQTDERQPSLFSFPPEEPPSQLNIPQVIQALRPAMTNPKIGKAAHHADFDLIMLARYGLEVAPIIEDTMIAEWVINPDATIGLKDVSQHRLNIHMQPINTLIGSGRNQITFAQVPIEKAAPYAVADAVVTYQLVAGQRAELATNERLQALYQDFELPLIPILVKMEMAGVLIDAEHLGGLSQELGHKQRQIEIRLFEMVGETFNLNSLPQLNHILFNKLKLPTAGLKKTPRTKHFQLTADVLSDLAERVQEETDPTNYEFLKLLLDYRGLQKLLSTYIEALPALIHPQTGRVHTSFRQTGTVTGRLSSDKPNLQNIPIRTEEGRRIRGAFVAKPGYLLLSADYSQIELRILAHYSSEKGNDEILKKAFEEGQDIHSATAAIVNRVPISAVTADQRRLAKSVNFGLMYGMGAFRLARETELSLAEARKFIENYFNTFPGVRDYLDNARTVASELGYVETLYGRRRYFPQLKDEKTSAVMRQRAEREAINMPIQGTAADMMKAAMIALDARLSAEHPDVDMLLQVHDELIFEVPAEKIDTVQALVVEVMEAVGGEKLSVPIEAKAKSGLNWAELE